jgi:hypothetical protein
MSTITRRTLLRVAAWQVAVLGSVVAAGCGGGGGASEAKKESVPSGPIKPVPKKKGVGKNQLEKPLDPRELLKQKSSG